MFAALYLCICVLACEIWVCLFRVFFPSVIFAARVLHVCACMSVSEKFHSVYSAVEKERKGKGGGVVTYLPSCQTRGERSAAFYSQVSIKTHTYLSLNIC